MQQVKKYSETKECNSYSVFLTAVSELDCGLQAQENPSKDNSYSADSYQLWYLNSRLSLPKGSSFSVFTIRKLVFCLLTAVSELDCGLQAQENPSKDNSYSADSYQLRYLNSRLSLPKGSSFSVFTIRKLVFCLLTAVSELDCGLQAQENPSKDNSYSADSYQLWYLNSRLSLPKGSLFSVFTIRKLVFCLLTAVSELDCGLQAQENPSKDNSYSADSYQLRYLNSRLPLPKAARFLSSP
ncbi:unnamed protein product [Rhizophagus irregularis]|nr:unnamed protein product [Rhizophagus irregularis]